MAKATEIIGCTINGRTPSEREVTHEQSIIAKAVFNGDDIYGIFSWVRIARTQEPIFEFEDGKFKPIDSKIPYRANEDGFSFDFGTEATSPLGLCLYVQIGNGTTIMQTYIMTFYYQYFNTWTAIISPGWAWDAQGLGFDEECGVSVCNNIKNYTGNHRIFFDTEHGSKVGEISEVAGGVGFSVSGANDGYSTGNNSGAVPDKYLKHYVYPTPQNNEANVPFEQHYLLSVPNGTYKISTLSCCDRTQQAVAVLFYNTIKSILISSYKKTNWQAKLIKTITVDNGCIDYKIWCGATRYNIIPINAIKLEKID